MTRRAFAAVPRTAPHRVPDTSVRKGEPIVTAIWMTVSAMTLVLGLSLPCLGALDSPLQGYVVPTVALLYAVAMAATCLYNRVRYGRVWVNPLPAPRPRRAHGNGRRPVSRRSKAPLAVMIG